MNNELVIINNGQPVTNSLLVAEKFEKRHVEVLDAIRELLRKAENSTFVENQRVANMFFLIENEIPMPIGGGTKKNPMYLMNRDGFTLLTMGFTGEKALQFKIEYIEAFGKMESMLQSDDYILMRSQEILQNRVKSLESKVYQQQEQLDISHKQIEELTPDAEYTRKVLTSNDTFTTTQIAKEFGWGAPTLNEKLRQAGVQYKQNGQWLLMHKYQGKGYTKTNTYSEIINGETRTYHSTVWTEAGRAFLHNLVKKLNLKIS